MTDFEYWWYHEGSGPPLRGEDFEEHCKRMCQIAWSNGAFKAREAAAKVAADYGPSRPVVSKNPSQQIVGRWEGEQAASSGIAAAIRKGDQE